MWLGGKLLARKAPAVVCLFVLSGSARAGESLYVAGVSYFDPASKGTPLVWAQGAVTYYTDPGDLSPVLPHPAADALVADAFSRWTNISTVALVPTQAGQLAEDVNATNVSWSGGVLDLPPDIQPGAVGTPVGLVYDFDGQVNGGAVGQRKFRRLSQQRRVRRPG